MFLSSLSKIRTTKTKMKILNSILRAVVERVTELEWHHKGARLRLWVFEHLGREGETVDQWIQNWETDDVTDNFSRTELQEIYDVVDEYYKCEASK